MAEKTNFHMQQKQQVKNDTMPTNSNVLRPLISVRNNSAGLPMFPPQRSLNVPQSCEVKNEVSQQSPHYSSASTSSSFIDETNNYRVPYQIQENLRNIINQNPDGIRLRKLPEVYRKMYKQNIDYNQYGFTSLAQLCCSLDTIFRYIHSRADGGILYSANKKIHDVDEDHVELGNCFNWSGVAEQSNTKVKALPDVVTGKNPINFQNDMVMQPGDYIEVEVLTTDENNEYTPIIIQEVYDVSKFWFNLVENNNYVNAFYVDIQDFYDSEYKSYAVSYEQLEKGLYVIYYKGNSDYQRAVIVKFDKLTVTVFCIDDGTVGETTIDNIFFLHRKFSDLPRQGMRGRLNRLVPPVKDAQWCRNASARLWGLVKDRTVHGSVDFIDDTQVELVYNLVLCDVSSNEDVFLHEVLIHEGFAVPSVEDQKVVPKLYDEYEPVVPDLHMYPTFSDLESAELPSGMEMVHLTTQRIPLYKIYPMYFKRKEVVVQNPLKKVMNHIKKLQLSSSSKYNLKVTNANVNVDSTPLARKINKQLFVGNNKENLSLTTTSDSECSVSNPGLALTLKPKALNSQPQHEYKQNLPTLTNQETIAASTSPLAGVNQINNQASIYRQPNLQIAQSLDNFQQNVSPKSQPTLVTNIPNLDLRFLTQGNILLADFMKNNYGQGKNEQIYYFGQSNNPLNLFSQLNCPLNSLKKEENIIQQQNLNSNNILNTLVSCNAQPIGLVYSIFCNDPKGGTTVYDKNDVYMSKLRRPRLKTKKKSVLPIHVFGKVIHVVRVMATACVVTWEVQEAFTGRNDPALLRRLLQKSDVVAGDLPLDSLNESIITELHACGLIKDKTSRYITYTTLANLQKFISCITNTTCEITDFDALVVMYSDKSPIWVVDE